MTPKVNKSQSSVDCFSWRKFWHSISVHIVLTFFMCLGLNKVWAVEMIHHGPVLDVKVKRGEKKLPLLNVPHLKQGDIIQVTPESGTLDRGGWVLQLARVSPSSNLVETFGFDLSDSAITPELEITADGQVLVILLAPQLRNLFGLNTRLTESSDLLSKALKSDSQRFLEFQQVDQINQAVTALSRGLDDHILNEKPDQGLAVTKAFAIQFGVSQIDADCYKNNAINTQCVAVNIVANKDFTVPSTNELALALGPKNATDLTRFMAPNIKVFLEAGDFLTHKYRDQYDFVPTFGRQKGDSSKIELYSLSRFKNGTLKTAYVYVPAWFDGGVPLLQANQKTPACLFSGQFDLLAKGRLPFRNYWHSWTMTLADPETRDELANLNGLTFFPERGFFRFNKNFETALRTPKSNVVIVFLSGMFGFDPFVVEPFKLSLPLQGDLSEKIQGIKQLVAGDISEVGVLALEQSGCIKSFILERNGKKLLGLNRHSTNRFSFDLASVSAGDATLSLMSIGASPQTLPVQILPQRARVSSVEHFELDDFIVVAGESLERIAEVDLGQAKCTPNEIVERKNVQDRLVLSCAGPIKINSNLPEKVLIRHKQGKPSEFEFSLLKKTTMPRLSVARSKNALIVQPSPKSVRWGLSTSESIIADDSGLSLIIQPTEGFELISGSYVLELRFVDDPESNKNPISAVLMMDMADQELRARHPISLKNIELPSEINPIEFRVRHITSVRGGVWRPLNKSILMIPDIKDISCGKEFKTVLIHGTHLEFIDGARLNSVDEVMSTEPTTIDEAVLVSCTDGMCLQVPIAHTQVQEKLLVQLHWLNERIFSVDLEKLPQCTWAESQ